MTPQAAKLLAKRSTLDILEVVTFHDRSVKEIAEAVGLELEPAWRKVSRLCEAGLLVVVGKRSRAGRAQKLYRASAREFFVPAERRYARVATELAAVVEQQLEVRDRAIGERFFHDGQRWRVEKRYSVDATIADRQEDRWLIANLTYRQRQELTKAVVKLFEQYGAQQQPSAKRSIIRFACVTAPD